MRVSSRWAPIQSRGADSQHDWAGSLSDLAATTDEPPY